MWVCAGVSLCFQTPCWTREVFYDWMFVQTSFFSPSATIQKRLKKEKKAKRKLQDALEFESKRREQVEQALKQATSPESLRMSLNGGALLWHTQHWACPDTHTFHLNTCLVMNFWSPDGTHITVLSLTKVYLHIFIFNTLHLSYNKANVVLLIKR